MGSLVRILLPHRCPVLRAGKLLKLVPFPHQIGTD